MVGLDKVPTQDECDEALKEGMNLDKMIVKLGQLNELDMRS